MDPEVNSSAYISITLALLTLSRQRFTHSSSEGCSGCRCWLALARVGPGGSGSTASWQRTWSISVWSFGLVYRLNYNPQRVMNLLFKLKIIKRKSLTTFAICTKPKVNLLELCESFRLQSSHGESVIVSKIFPLQCSSFLTDLLLPDVKSSLTL